MFYKPAVFPARRRQITKYKHTKRVFSAHVQLKPSRAGASYSIHPASIQEYSPPIWQLEWSSGCQGESNVPAWCQANCQPQAPWVAFPAQQEVEICPRFY
jgi:hypothetical protein